LIGIPQKAQASFMPPGLLQFGDVGADDALNFDPFTLTTTKANDDVPSGDNQSPQPSVKEAHPLIEAPAIPYRAPLRSPYRPPLF